MGEAKRRKETGKPSQAPRTTQRPILLGGVAIVVVLIAATLYYLTSGPDPSSADLPVAAPGAAPFPVQADRFGVSIGDPDAPVVVREFADFQCPACASFASAASRLKEEYVASGQVRFVYFDLPLQQHENSMPAALAARCAGDQDAYWQMHDQLFSMQTEWSGSNSPTDTFSRYAGDLGLDERRFRNCMNTELHREDVEQSHQLARTMRVLSTPTVFVDNIRLTRPGWGQMSAVVERELAKEAE